MSPSTPHDLPALLAHREWVRSLARNLVGDPDAAEDLAQQAMVVALERPPARAGNLRGWLAQVVRNLVRQGARRHTELDSRASDEAPPSPATHEVVARAEAQHVVAEEVLALAEPYRETVLLRYFDDLAPREIARRQGRSLATVTSRLTRAHAMLRERLERRQGGGGRGWLAALAPVLDNRGPSAAAASGALIVTTQVKAALLLGALVVGGFLASRALELGPAGLPAVQPSADAARASIPPEAAPPLPDDAGPRRDRIGTVAPAVAAAPVASAPARLAGRVLDPSGAPAEGAIVVVGDALQLRFLDLGEEPGDGVTWTETDAEGHFALENVTGKTVRLTAGSSSAAPSETLAVHPDEESTRDDLTLQLRVGVRIHGDVSRRDGSLARHRKVRLLKEATNTETSGLRLMRNVVTDGQGRFDARHLHPGSWGLVSYPDDGELAELGGTMPEHMVQATVTLADGEEQYVALGAATERAVTVSGRLEDGTGPVSGMLQWIGECDDPMGSQVIAEAGDDGHYTVELPAPGTWYMRVIAANAHAEYYVDVPAADEYAKDFLVPAATVSGRIVDPDGKPVAGATVTHMVHEGVPYRLGLSTAMDQVRTGEDGSFRFQGVAPGTYQVGAVHRERGVASATLATVAAAEAVDGLQLTLHPGVPLTGVVRGPDERPLAGAPIWIHDASGRVANPVTTLRTNKEGRFRTPPLPRGRHALVCQVGTLVAIVRDLEPDTDAAREITLQLEPGAALRVTTTADGEAVRAQVRVVDSAGRVLSGLRNASDPWSWKRYPFDSRTRWVGPLPAGDYTVTAHVPELGNAATNVAVEAGETKDVALRY